MGKRRAYCPYCDVFLVHNSLRSRRDHNEGWRHVAAFQAYYARFAAQTLRSTPRIEEPDITSPRPNTSTGPNTRPVQTQISPPQNSPTIKPPTIVGTPIKPPSIHPPNITAGASTQIRPPSITPAAPKIAPPQIKRAAPPPIRSGPPPIQKKDG